MAPRRSGTVVVGLIGAVITGGFIVGQARVNGELGAEIGNGLIAALVSFGAGLVLLLVASSTLPAGRRGLRRVVQAARSGVLRPWQLLGGLGGALLVASQGLTTTLLGTALFTIAVVAGQSAGGLAVDRVGLGPAGAQATTVPRVVGAVLMLGAVGLAVGPSLNSSAPVALAVLPLLAGLAIAAQQAVNGQVAAIGGHDRTGVDNGAEGGADGSGEADSWLASVLPAATVNFMVGMVALAVAAGISVAVEGPPSALPSAAWLYLGGPLGAIFIALAAWLVGRIGVLLLALGSVAGQVVTAVVLDVIAPAAAGTPGVTTVLGAALTLVAAGVASLPSRHRAAGSAATRDAPRVTGSERSDLP